MISKIQAIQSLVPGAEVSVAVHDDSVTWINYENPPITDEQIAAEQKRLQMIHDWHEYRRNRAVEYPTIQEQLDALYHAGVFPSEMAARIRAVKEKYPTPTMTPEQLAEFNKQQQPAEEPDKLSVDQWFAEQKNASTQLDFQKEQQHWIAQQQVSNTPMTREEWLESQLKIALPGTETMVAEPQRMTREEWLENQLRIVAPDIKIEPLVPAIQKMTREEWLESQLRMVFSTPTPAITVPQTMTREEWLEWQKSL